MEADWTENFEKRNPVKGENAKGRDLPERETGQTTGGSMIDIYFGSVSGRTDKIILPGLPAVCDGLFPFHGSGSPDTAFRYSSKEQQKENRQKPVKAPLWHKHKEMGLAHHQSKLLFWA